MTIIPTRITVGSNGNVFQAQDPRLLTKFFQSVRLPNTIIGRANGYKLTRDGGVGHILLTRSDLALLDRSASNHTLTFRGTGYPPPYDTVTISNLHITDAFAVLGTTTQKQGDVYLVEFKDRYDYLKFSAIDKGYNIRTPNWNPGVTPQYFESTTNGGSPYSWNEMVLDMWGSVTGMAGSLSTTRADFPAEPPENRAFFGMNMLEALRGALTSINHYLVIDTTGQFHVIAASDSDETNQTHLTNATSLTVNFSDPLVHTKTRVPQHVRVFFTRNDGAFQLSNDQRTNNAADLWNTQPTLAKTIEVTSVVPDITGTIEGAIASLNDDMPAEYDETGTLLNDDTLTERAEERTVQYVADLRSDTTLSDLYQAPIPFEPGSYISGVHWYDFGDGMRTQVSTSPKKDGAFGTSGGELPTPPDLIRSHLPHERFGIAKIYNADIVAGGSGLARMQFGTLAGPLIAWANTPLPHEITLHNPHNFAFNVDTVVIVMFHRQTSRWVIVNDGGGEGLIRFELYGGDLNLAGEQTAKVCSVQDGDWIATDTIITVMDPYDDPGVWSGKVGYQGFCIKRLPDADTGVWDGKYDIVYMEEQAMFVEFTADEDRDPVATNFQAVYDASYHGKVPPLTSGKLTIYDTQKIYPRILKGCKGKAVWDDERKIYEVLTCQQRVLMIRGEATDYFCSDDPSIGITQVVAMSFSPIGYMPEEVPNSALNIGLAVEPGDIVIAAWDEEEEEYRVLNVKHKEFTIPTKIEWDETTKCLRKKTLRIAISTCDTESEWENIICGEECTPAE